MDKITVDNSKNEKYWQDRIILKDKLLERDVKKIEKELLKLYKDTKKEVLNELKILYSDMEHTEYAKYRIESLLSAINKSLDNLYSGNEEALKNGLEQIYKEMYKQASIDLEVSFNTINDDLIKEVTATEWGTKLNDEKDVFVLHEEVRKKLEENWSGATLIERIQEHKRKLSFTLKEELAKGLIRGDSLQEISKRLSDKMDLAYSNSMRMVRTESCWIMNEATKQNYLDNDIKYYEFSAFLDKKTSKICKELDGKIIKVEEAIVGKNMPPLHPNCRSCMIPIAEELKLEKDKEEATKEPKNISPIEELKSKGVKVDIDSFKNIDKKLLDENIAQFNKLIDKYPIVKKYIDEKEISFGAKKIKGTTIAQIESNIYKENLKFFLNENSYKDYTSHIDEAIKNVKNKWHSATSKDYYPVRTTTHEFGHIVHDCIIHNYNKENPKKLEKVLASSMKTSSLSASMKKLNDYQLKIVREYNKEMIQIAKELEEGFSIEKNLSRYGQTNSFEFFAECFAEYECEGGTTIAKAMEQLLKKRGFI